ncbi:hypothetical protein N6H05_09590 [Sphingobium sp. WTD-1]|uniref:hypothetical protein n=1 Tax=Sphingobium sp. WTD-1 TaxID=2979467 RepID=UPI0024DEB312|nr:hypothetical protein [Sphingobium sp. WTD-1]WIA58022.1 hypothetical protein N6H05_09590 [Sphingobium sp. WTD-1]
MTDLLDIAARLEDACDISGKPAGRHMVEPMRAVVDHMAIVAEDEADGELSSELDAQRTLIACIDNEAKLFDALAIVAKEAVDILRAIGDPHGGAAFAIVGHKAEDADPKDGQFALAFNVSDNASAWSTPWVVGYWSEDGHQWFDHEGYPLTPSHVIKLPTAAVFMQAEGIRP